MTSDEPPPVTNGGREDRASSTNDRPEPGSTSVEREERPRTGRLASTSTAATHSPPTLPAVVLFDVDETLVHTGGAGARSWTAAFAELHGVDADIGEHSSAGETDPQVARATFEGVLGRQPTTTELARLYASYLRYLAGAIWASEGYRVLPGAADTLAHLADAGVVLGVVSGAMEGAARTKLVPANLNRYFVFGGYGSDAEDRAEVTAAAMARAQRMVGRQLGRHEVLVVGDTPHDISSASRAGALGAGVTTGHYARADLEKAGADIVVESLELLIASLGVLYAAR